MKGVMARERVSSDTGKTPGTTGGSVLRRLAPTLAATLALVSLVACATPTVPDRPADIGGVVQDVTDSTFLVMAVGAVYEYDRAWVTVTDDTVILDTQGNEVSFGHVPLDSEVQVWFTGPVAESYPVQAAASHVRLTQAIRPEL
jgi:hypothetical protein